MTARLIKTSDLVTAGDGVAYYVSSTGNNSNDGLSVSTAWASVSKVNASTFRPGDSILFEGGQTFAGAIVAPSGGTPDHPITFGSYGGGKATISSSTSNGFTSTSLGGIIVRDLVFTGSASTNQGIKIDNGLASNIHLQFIRVFNCNVSGYGLDGIAILGTNGTAGFDDVVIDGCASTGNCSVSASGTGSAGIRVRSAAGYGSGTTAPAHINVVVSNCLVKDNLGATDTNWTGSGIVLTQVREGIVSNCIADGNGGSCVSSTGGPGGIWTADCDSVVIENCIAKNTASGNSYDGNGFGTDGGCLNCTIRDCYSFNNAGAGYQVWSYNDGSVSVNDGTSILNCTSVGDGAGGSSNSSPAGIRIGGSSTLTNVKVLGNSVYQTVANSWGIYVDHGSTTGVVANNTFIYVAGTGTVYSDADATGLVFNGNRYIGSLSISWNASTYTTLKAWNTAVGQEANGTLNANTVSAGLLKTDTELDFLGSTATLKVNGTTRIDYGASYGGTWTFPNVPSGTDIATIAATGGITVSSKVTDQIGRTAFYDAIDASNDSAFTTVCYNANINGAGFTTLKTRASGSTAASTALQPGDIISSFFAYGADGSDYQQSSKIRQLVDPTGTVSTGNVPGKIVFYTAGNSSGLLERMSIDKDGLISLATKTVSALPAAGTAGRKAFVTDANATTFNSVVAGGGSNKVPVFDNGTNWCIG